MVEEAVKVFISYSHKDEELRDKLEAHLSILRWDGVISSWYDRQLTAGVEWDNKIKSELESADIILLLISPDFIASQYCREIEIPIALQRNERKQASVIPIILRPFDWTRAPFAKLQTFPKDAKPVTTWENQDEAFVNIAQGIRTVAQLIQNHHKQERKQKQLIRSQYLQKVEEVLSDGVISIVERDTLDELRGTLGLTLDEAKKIEAHAYEPFSRYEENLNKYKQTLNRLIEKGYYPFSKEIEKDLINRQRDLGLKSDDVALISKPILAEAEFERKNRLEQQHQKVKKNNEVSLESYKQEKPKVIQSDSLLDKYIVNHELDDGYTAIGMELLIEESSTNSNILKNEEFKTKELSRKDKNALIIINKLFDILSSPNTEIASQEFRAIAHKSLFENGRIEPAFQKASFDVAMTRLHLYKQPIEIIKSKPTGRNKLGRRGSKEYGKEEKFSIARKEDIGGLEGHIRIFFPANSASAKVSGFNL